MTKNKQFHISFDIQTIGIIIAALGSVAALISAWIQIAPGKPELEARIISIEEFSARPKIEGLVGEFTYKGEQIKRLVTLRVSIINIGNKTIIGNGSQKNIIGDVLTVNVPNTLKIVNTTVLSNDFNAKLSNIEGAIIISFNQWRPTEALETLIYLKAEDVQISEYLIKKEREILDGNFNIINTISNRTGKNPLVDYLPSGYIKGIKAFGYLSLAILFPLGIMLAIEPFKTRIQATRWEKVNSKSFSLFVEDKLSFLPAEEKEQLKSDPSLMKKIIWKQYDGERYSDTFGDSAKEAFLLTVVFLLVSLGCIPLFVALHYLY